MNIVRCFLAVSISLSLIACGNESGDKPDALPEIPPPPAGGYDPDFSDFETVASIDLAELETLTGQDLIDGLEQQLNDSLLTRSSTAQFKIDPLWGVDTNLRVVNVDGYYALETTLTAGKVGKPSGGDLNGFSFKISLPNGVVKQATLSYQLSLSQPLGLGDTAKSPDYIYLPGLTSGAPEVQNNKPATAGTGFTYKFSTDRYGYLNAKYADPTNGDLTNAQLQYAEKGIKPTQGQWDLIQQNITINDFNQNAAQANGSVTTYFNREMVTPNSGSTTDRILVDETHPYNLQALVEVYRYYRDKRDDISTIKEQKVRIKNLSFAWNNDEVALPPPVDDEPDLTGYPNIKVLDLELLAGMQGSDLIAGIQQQLNESLPKGTTGTFKVIPKWGFADNSAWDSENLTVQNIQGQYVLQTTIAAQTFGKPSSSKPMQNGFSFLIELPNGKVKEATMSYLYRLSTPLGNGDPSKSPDYITLPGLTSGAPSVPGAANAPSEDGAGFTYILNTTRDRTLNARFIDATDSDFRNSPLKQGKDLIRIEANLWHLVQQKLQTNDFLGSAATADGSLEIAYKTNSVQPQAGLVTGRTQVDEQHNYKLSAQMEVYRYWMNSLDKETDLKEQIVQIKNITFAWKDEEIGKPTAPTPENYCSNKGFQHTRLLDLKDLEGADSQTISDAIATQLSNTAAQLDNTRNNLSVVSIGNELALKITYAAGSVGKDEAGNGSSVTVDFPIEASLNEACMAYDVQFELDVHADFNDDLVFLPSMHIKNTGSNDAFAKHDYVINHSRRIATKFTAKYLNWHDSSSQHLGNNKWHTTLQALTLTSGNTGTIDHLLNNSTHFKAINSEEFNMVEYPVLGGNDINNSSLVASFDSYRPDRNHVGNADQALYFKNIAIGWNTAN